MLLITTTLFANNNNKINNDNTTNNDNNANNNNLRRSSRETKNPYKRNQVLTAEEIHQVLMLAEEPNTPLTIKEALSSPQAQDWQESIDKEVNSLIKKEVFQVVPRPQHKKPIQSKTIFKIKRDEKGEISSFKTRIVAKGFTQIQGLDYFDTFSPTLRSASFRYLISLAVIMGWKIYNLDVQTAFLHGELEEEIYMEIPEAFLKTINVDRRNQVFLLLKSIYGLKQASRAWNDKFTESIKKMGYIQSSADPCIFIKYDKDGMTPIAVIGIFVDDCFLLGIDSEIELAREMLKKEFEMHDLGLLKHALGIKVDQEGGTIKISQPAYIQRLLEKFNMQDCTPTTTPLPEKSKENDKSEPFQDINLYQQLVGALIYLSNATRPDIAYTVGDLARSMQKPTQESWTNAKRTLRYLKGTINLGLHYSTKDKLVGYSDSSYAETKDRKSIGGYCFMQAGAAITWRSTKQDIVAQSSMEAEYIALAETAKEALWLRKFEQDLFRKDSTATLIFEDNQSAIKLAENPIHTSRSKHIDTKYHAIRDYIKKHQVIVKFKPTAEMTADIMTKSLGRVLHQRFATEMGLIEV